MKTIDIARGRHSLDEVLTLAKSETICIRSASGEDFLLEPADAFEREVVALGGSEKFISFLNKRSQERGDIPLSRIRAQRRK